MTFTQPLLLWALLPAALLAIGYLIMQRRRTRYAVRFAALPMLERIVPRRSGWRRHAAAGLVIGALATSGLAAAGPEVNLRVPYERATVMVAIDISGSMRADDVAPDRLTAAKQAAVDFVTELPDTFNVGVVAFAGQAIMVAPASTDHNAAARAIERLEPAGGGTALGDAVFASADEVLRQAVRPDPDVTASTGSTDEEPAELIPAWLVLLSDGDNTAGREPADALVAAAGAQMPISAIAYGTAEGVIESADGGSTPVPVDEETLRLLADESSGHFYQAESSDQLHQVYSDIGSSIGWRTQIVNITTHLILLGLGLAAAAAGLSMRWFSRLT